jgi:restriction endonuclease S subunit
MGLKTFTIDFQELAIDPKVGLKDYSSLYKTGIRLKSFLLNKKIQTDIKSGRTPSRFKKEYWYGENEFLTMSDVDTLTFSINPECADKITDYAIDEEKTLYQARENSLIVSNAMTVGLSFISDRPVFINQNVFEVNLDETKVNKKFVLWYLNLIVRPLFQTTYTSKYLSKDELGRIKIPFITKVKQDQAAGKIEPIEKKIKELKSQTKKPQEIINKIFVKGFRFDTKKFEKLKEIKYYYLDLFSFGNNRDIRQSVKFHRQAGIFVNTQLKKITSKKIKDFISEPIVLGKSVSPKNYDENGEFCYISMANIKNWKFESEDSKLVSKNYSEQNKNKAVAKNDILIARSGEGTIGKAALIEDKKAQGIFSDFTMRIRLQKYNPLFAYYYFRTDFFQYLIEINKKGLGNNTNIFPSQVQEFPMINISLKSQQEIVNEIKAELDKQKEIKQKIKTERNKIVNIIESIIA